MAIAGTSMGAIMGALFDSGRTGEPVVFQKGDLLTAIKASMAIPGVFVPLEHEGRILVDGGVVNNLPYEMLRDSCGYTIAIDVCSRNQRGDAEPPDMLEATVGMFDILIGRKLRLL